MGLSGLPWCFHSSDFQVATQTTFTNEIFKHRIPQPDNTVTSFSSKVIDLDSLYSVSLIDLYLPDICFLLSFPQILCVSFVLCIMLWLKLKWMKLIEITGKVLSKQTKFIVYANQLHIADNIAEV